MLSLYLPYDTTIYKLHLPLGPHNDIDTNSHTHTHTPTHKLIHSDRDTHTHSLTEGESHPLTHTHSNHKPTAPLVQWYLQPGPIEVLGVCPSATSDYITHTLTHFIYIIALYLYDSVVTLYFCLNLKVLVSVTQSVFLRRYLN